MQKILSTIRYTLCYPSPEDSGGSGGSTEPIDNLQSESSNDPSHEPTEGESKPSDVSSTAKELMDSYSNDGEISDDDETSEPSDDTQGGGESSEEYALAFSEEFSPDPAFLELVTPHAKELGIDAAQAGGLVERTIASIKVAEYASMVESDAALKADWGSDYQTNKKAVESYKVQLREMSGLSKDDMAVFNSPKGYRLLHALMSSTQSKPTAGLGRSESSSGENTWAREVMKNPAHADYQALRNPSDPRWREVNARYNKAMGIT